MVLICLLSVCVCMCIYIYNFPPKPDYLLLESCFFLSKHILNICYCVKYGASCCGWIREVTGTEILPSGYIFLSIGLYTLYLACCSYILISAGD